MDDVLQQALVQLREPFRITFVVVALMDPIGRAGGGDAGCVHRHGQEPREPASAPSISVDSLAMLVAEPLAGLPPTVIGSTRRRRRFKLSGPRGAVLEDSGVATDDDAGALEQVLESDR